MRNTLLPFLLSIALLPFGSVLAQTIPHDYPGFPAQPFDFEHLVLEVTLEPEAGLVRGVASYSITPKVNAQQKLILQTQGSAIDGVLLNDEEIDFEILSDSLVIHLMDAFEAGEQFELAITWQSNSLIGLNLDHNSTFWSSKNPLAHHHWLPVFDHPTNELTIDAHFVIPIGTEVMFNGELEGSELQAGEKKRISYSSSTILPVTGLGFVLGDFIISEVTSGLTTIRLFADEQGYPEEQRIELIREASQLKKDIERELSMEYPWDGLNIVVLPDNYWEERTHGAGVIYLYERLGNLLTQLKRGLYAQWIGEYQRGQQFFDSRNFGEELMRTALHYKINEEAAIIENPDSLLTISGWNAWQQSYELESDIFKNTVQQTLPELLRTEEGIVEFEEYADVWYERTGMPYFDIAPSQIIEVEKSVESTAEQYEVDVLFDELSSELNLVFELKEGSGEELHTLYYTEIGFQDTIPHEATFTGALDTVSITLSNSVEFISFTGSENVEKLEFDEFPLFFLLNMLRSETLSDRVFAAELISSHSENPDLQLALNDVMAFESDPEVKAALLGAMAEITNGASGTQQQFLDELNNSDASIQSAAIEALVNYPEDEMVASALRNKVLRAQESMMFMKAFGVYAQVAKVEDIVSLAQRLQRVDTTGAKVLEVIQQSSDVDTTGTYISLTEEYISNTYPYSIRKQALGLLMDLDTNEESWASRMEELSKDRDPRIRYAALEAIKWLPVSESFNVLSSLEREELDARVLNRIKELLEGLSE